MDPKSADSLLLYALDAPDDELRAGWGEHSAGVPWNGFVAQSLRHEVAPLVYRRLTDIGIEQDVPAEVHRALRQAYAHAAARSALFYDELARVLRALQDNDIRVVVLKGAHLAEVVYGNIALRPMYDLDLLIRWEDVRRSDAILLGLGYSIRWKCPREQIEQQKQAELANNHHLPPYVNEATGIPVELQWDLEPLTSPLQIPIDGMWQRARPARVAGVETLLLSVEDLLLHVCHHASYHHSFGMGLLPLCDIAKILQHHRNEITWSSFLGLTQAYGLGESMYYTLFMASKMLRAEVPDAVLAELKPAWTDPQFIEALEKRILRVPTSFQWRSPFQRPPEALLRPARANRAANRSRNRLLGLLRGVFPSRDELRVIYALPPGSPRVYGHYLLHLYDLCRLRGSALLQAVLEAWRHRTSLRSAANKIVIRNWLKAEQRRYQNPD